MNRREEFGDFGSMASTQKWDANAITVDLPVQAVVISKQGEDVILFIERSNSFKDRRAYFRITSASKNTAEEECKGPLRIRDVVTVLEAEHVDLDEETAKMVDFSYEPHRHVLTYEFNGSKQQPGYCEVAAIAEVTEDYVVVVSSTFSSVHQAGIYYKKADEEFTVGQFVMINCYPCEPDVRRFMKRHPLKENFEYYYYQKVYNTGNQQVEITFRPDEVRALTELEIKWIRHRLRSKKITKVDEESLNLAVIYIRDPHIASYALEEYLDWKAAQNLTLEINAVQIQACRNKKASDQDLCILQFLLTEEQYQRCLVSDSQHCWRTSTNLTVMHNGLRNGNRCEAAYVTLHNQKVQKDHNWLVELITEKRSALLMLQVMQHPRYFLEEGPWTIGPMCNQSAEVIAAIKEGFGDFFKREETFKQYAGWTDVAEMEDIPDKEAPFFVKGAPLDPHQLAFMKASAHNPGWTCAQAPPGCGKTHTTSALVSYLNGMEVRGGVCISGTTNAAVTNAADAVKENFPEISIIRNYSQKAEYDITEKSQAISLKSMAENCELHLDEENNGDVFKARKSHLKSVQKYQNTNFEKLGAQANAYNKMQERERTLKTAFIGHYRMNVYATTVELLIRQGDMFALGAVGDTEEFQNKAISRIILDEAAQLSPTEALALYCRLPHLTHITLLGDTYQLGPHSRIERGTEVYNFKTEGELTRMMKLPSTIKKSLNGLYRCHPKISEKVLLPIYGSAMEPRATEVQRNLAALRKLPVAADGSPVVWFHVVGKEEKCSNIQEAIQVIHFVSDLVCEYGVDHEDIVILVFHRQQKIKLEDLFTDNNMFMRGTTRIETVDSFQGKEAKIIILCTTKSVLGEEQVESKLQFIAEPQRATVALSRAQHALYIFGDLFMLAKSKFYAKIMNTLIQHQGFADNKATPPNEDDEHFITLGGGSTSQSSSVSERIPSLNYINFTKLKKILNRTMHDVKEDEKKAKKEALAVAKAAAEAKKERQRAREEKKEKKEKKKSRVVVLEAGNLLDNLVDIPLPKDKGALVTGETLEESQTGELERFQAQLMGLAIENEVAKSVEADDQIVEEKIVVNKYGGKKMIAAKSEKKARKFVGSFFACNDSSVAPIVPAGTPAPLPLSKVVPHPLVKPTAAPVEVPEGNLIEF